MPGVPQWLVIVRRDQLDLYEYMRQAWAPVKEMQVLLDRREGDRRAREVPVAVNRRRSDRRRPWPQEDLATWQRSGYRRCAASPRAVESGETAAE